MISLSSASAAHHEHRRARLDGVDCTALREVMLGLVGDTRGPLATQLRMRIHLEPRAEDLWHLRPHLMQVLAGARGEARARQDIARLDGLFLALWPEAPVSRPAPLR